jgi:hypothetical protein
MNSIKKILGGICLLLAPAIVILLVMQAADKIGKAAEGVMRTNTSLQWGIILFIFVPIAIGFMIFGYYALKGEYDE